MGEERLPRRMFGDVRGSPVDRCGTGGRILTEEELKAFGINFEGWREAAQKIGRWC